MTNLLLLGGVAVVYFVALAALFRSRQRLGIGSFFCALGAMHFIETYLASIFYITLPFGFVASPGSIALFSGKLMMLLLVYIREDAAVVRQPIYGLLFGNLLMIALAILIRYHDVVPLHQGHSADFAFLDQIGALSIWGTALLFADCILIILVYERSRAWFGNHLEARLAASAMLVLTLDQVGFFAGLHLMTGAPWSVMLGGWVAKMAAALLFAVLTGAYLRHFDRAADRTRPDPRLADVFQILTYRERYEDLLARTGRDALTGALDRGRLEVQGRLAVDEAVLAGRPVSLLLVDIDHFKSFNDRFGHAAGDAVLKRIVGIIMATVQPNDLVFRFGGEEFIVICDDRAGSQALALCERIRRAIATCDSGAGRVTVSIGVASCAEDGCDYDSLFAIADRRLYQAKANGRNCVVGEPAEANGATPVRLAYAG